MTRNLSGECSSVWIDILIDGARSYSEFWVLGFGFGVLGFWVWVMGSGFWVLGFGFWVLGFGFWVLGFWFRVLGLGFWVLDFESWIQHLVLTVLHVPRLPDSGFRCRGLGEIPYRSDSGVGFQTKVL